MSRQPNRGHQLIGALLVIATATVATVIVVVTRNTAGLVDLATLVLTVSSVVVPIAMGRRTKRNRR